jgi:hypothetical protein
MVECKCVMIGDDPYVCDECIKWVDERHERTINEAVKKLQRKLNTLQRHRTLNHWMVVMQAYEDLHDLLGG